jgi:hypothetical protein
MKNSKEYLDRVSKILEPPYFYEMINLGIIDEDEQEEVLRKVYKNDEIHIRQTKNFGWTIFVGKLKPLYRERCSNNFWFRIVINEKNGVEEYYNYNGRFDIDIR